jgi:DNA-binding MarR family transcriptional regulator
MESSELASILRTSIGTLHKGFRKHMSAVSNYSMTELETIAALYRTPNMMPTELAVLTRITTQSMSQILTKFETLHLIKRSPSTKDKRKVYISLTSVGKKLVDKTKREGNVWLTDAIENKLSKKEKELLVNVLPVLNNLIDLMY